MKRQSIILILTLCLMIGMNLWNPACDVQAQAAGGCPLSFAPAQNYGVGTSPRFVVTGDFNGDGKPDVATANRDPNNVSVLLNNGDGTFAAAQNYGIGTNPEGLTTGDFNGDGKLDLAAANAGSNFVSILLGNGNGTFAPAINASVPNPNRITAGDFNGDGKLDLATTRNIASGVVYILLGNGDGTFGAPQSFGVGVQPRALTTGDFNGDGKLDLAVTNSSSDSVSILLGNGNGTFAAAQNYGTDTDPNGLKTGDFNGDGKLDLAVTNSISNSVSILLGNGNGTFAAAQNYGTYTDPNGLTTGDFNSDGKLDLATSNGTPDNVSVLLGNDGGTFAAAQNFAAGGNPFSITSADFNGDGALDLATANRNGNSVSVLLNTSCNTAPTVTANTVTRTAGAAASSATIATVNDAEDAENTLSVTATPASGSGVTLSGISVDSSGNVTATVAASCAATTSTFTLQVTDSGSLSATATLTVPVNANQLPVLSYPANPGTVYGTGITINPLTGPSDDVAVTGVLVNSITPTNPGGITVNSSGVVTVANNVPAGMYTVTIRANAACGNKDASFTLGIVKATPVITWNNPANITYGTALSATQLNATANVAGSFTYTPAAGTILNAGNGQILTANFTPTDATNYTTASKQVAINVLQAPLTVTVNNAFRNQGEANPPFSGSVTGQKNGDVLTATYNTTATIGSAPGTYPITATLVDPGNRLGNYQVTNTPGTLTILNSCGIMISPTTFLQPSLALPYAQPFSASPGGTYSFSLFAGTLPPGLQIVNNFGYYSLSGTPITPGTYTFTVRTQRSGSTCEAIRTYTVTIAPSVVPKVICKTLNANGSYTVRFGYENSTGAVVTIPVGANNYFASGAQNRGQTTVFQPGVVNNAFSVTFANAGAFTGWNLKGPDGVLRGVVPSVLLPNCP